MSEKEEGEATKMPTGDEEPATVIDAKLEEVEHLIEGLKKRRQELLEAKEALRAGKMFQKASELPRPVAPAPSPSDKALEEALNSLGWKSFRKKEGEWTFLREKDGRLRDDLEPVREFVDKLRKGGSATVGRYRYAVSEDRFLNRYFVVT